MQAAEVHRCPGCGYASQARRYEPLTVRCARGHRSELRFPTDGEAHGVTLGFEALLRRGQWLAAWQERAAGGPMVVAACERCEAPVTLARNVPLELACQRCGTRTPVEAERALMDVLPIAALHKPDWDADGGVRFAPFLQRITQHRPLDCPSCGTVVPAFEGRQDCAHCGTTLLMLTAAGERFVPGVRVQGKHDTTALDGWMPIEDALAYYDAYRKLGWYSMGASATAVGLHAVNMVVLTLSVLAAITFTFFATLCGALLSEQAAALGMATGIGLWALIGIGGLVVALVSLFVVPFLLHHRAKRRLGLLQAPEVFPLPAS